ncbi:MAG: 2-isopropylmalate synthase [Desulfarculaceae bacterium]|nr:2-isopropylmalate synthase [Desulfarculaceae bacterium]MCF8071000.1 2-isopropylmalate synthase [Desulfarculaceae bacterium]MCF8100588.1 2-isopropylmalate synthase [Desulfarculaceae bacterium]MCF8117720.1 2-isopropylmalate synthase [Desulfarculaceae bacterium]
MSSNHVKIFDTTLRDGEQSPGASMNHEEKLRLAQKLAQLNVDVMEVGFPASSPGDFEAVSLIAQNVQGPVICGLARTWEADIRACWDAVKAAEKKRIHVFIATSDIHLEHKLRLSREEVLKEITSGVTLAKSFCDDVEFSAEDATRTDPEFLAVAVQTALDAGATTINIPDTVGYTMPQDYIQRFNFLYEKVPGLKDVTTSVHCHDDLGLAVANSLAGVSAGARQVEGCINGIGERAGNASLEEVIMVLATREADLGLTTQINRKEIHTASRLVSMITGVVVQPNKAIVGANAFAHEAGIHVAGVLNQPLTYEIMTPEEVGLSQNSLVLGKHSGRAALGARLKEMGYKLSDASFEKLFEALKRLADKKKDIFNEDLEALIADEILRIPLRWRLDYMNIVSGTVTVPTATVRLYDCEELKQEFGSGSGPVDAVYNTIGKITGSSAELLRFTISAITGGLDAQGEVTVRLGEDGHVVLGKGSDPDILVAAAKAFINGLNRLEYLKTHAPVLKTEERTL